MSLGNLAFNVLTEFRFDVGHAVLNSETLQSKVEQLSGAADQALVSFQRLGAGIVAQFGLGTGSILGIMGQAIAASDKFGMNQRKLANIFLSNNDKIAGGAISFQQAMEASSGIMDEIAKKARDFGLPAQTLFDTTAQLGATLFSSGHAGTNLEPAIELSRQFLKSAPILGIDPQLAQNQLVSLIQGRGTMGDTLAQRLLAETSPFAPFKKGGIQGFNALEESKRIDVLTRALQQFASNSNVIAGNARSLSGEMQRLKDQLVGAFSVFRKLGDALMTPALKILSFVNDYISTKGKAVIANLAHFMRDLIESPKVLIINLMQLRQLKDDVKRAGGILSLTGIVLAIGGALQFLGITAALATPGIGHLVMALGVLFEVIRRGDTITGRIMGVMGIFAAFGALAARFPIIFQALGWAFRAVLWPATLLVGILQLLSRAQAIAKVRDAATALELMPKFTEMLARAKDALSNIFWPVIKIFNSMAEVLSYLFDNSFGFNVLLPLLDKVLWVFEMLGNGVMVVMGVISGVFAEIFNTYGRFFGPKGFDAQPFGKSFSESFDKFMAENLNQIKSGDLSSQQITNIGKVEIRNDFKEQQEPDRIAFTIKEQIIKAARNPDQGRRTSLNAGFFGPAF